jgi:Na+/alanine symporter
MAGALRFGGSGAGGWMSLLGLVAPSTPFAHGHYGR